MGSSEGSREAGESAGGWTARLWTLSGVLWGILLGAGAAMAVGGTAASFLWLYVFGDDPWPAWSRRAILAAGGSAAALALGTAAWAGRRHGLRAATGSPAERRLSRRRAMLTLLAALLGLGALGVAAWRQQAEATARREARDEAAGYLETRHRIRSLEMRRERDSLRLILRAVGPSPGRYAVSWRLGTVSGSEPLWTGADTVRLAAGRGRLERRIPERDLLRWAAVRVGLGAGSRGSADVILRTRVTLHPLPTPELDDRLEEADWNGLLVGRESAAEATLRVTVPSR